MLHKYYCLTITFLCLIACSTNAQKKVQKGSLIEKEIFFQYAIYFLDDKPSSIDVYKAELAGKYQGLKVQDSLRDFAEIDQSQLVLKEINNVKDSFAAPDLEYLKYAGRGLKDEEKNKLQNSNYVVLFDFACKVDDWYKTMQYANEILLKFSEQYKGLIWDSETREIFSTEFWKEIRVIKDPAVDIRKHITIHMYKDNDYCRAITLGMLKFGLPEVCIENLSCYSNQSVSSLMNLTAQTMFEKGKIDYEGKLSLDINLVKNKEFKDFLLESSYENAKGKGEIDIVEGKWQDGDALNRIIRLNFSENNPQIEHDILTTTLFGSEDKVTSVSHDEKILKASENAKKKAPKLKEKFLKGLPTGSYLLLKFPFNYGGDNNEWMWVEVVKWEGNKVKGILQNEPYYIKSLKAGQEVTKDINLMFDYILYLPDGSSEGNETGKLIMQQQN